MEAPTAAHPQNVGFSAWASFATSLTCREAIIQSRRAAPHKMEETAVGALAALPDDVVLRAFLRAPVTAHSSLYAVCHRLKDLLQSDDFRKLRVESGLAEYATIVAESEHDACVTSSWIFSHGRWRRIPTMAHARFTACSVIVDKEMWVIGGQETDGTVLATVEAYSFQTNSWRFCQALSQPRYGAVAGVDDDGRVLVAGGYGEDQRPLVSAEIYAEAGWSPVSLAAAMRAGLFRKSDEAVLPPPGCPILEGDIDPKRSARHYRSVLLG